MRTYQTSLQFVASSHSGLLPRSPYLWSWLAVPGGSVKRDPGTVWTQLPTAPSCTGGGQGRRRGVTGGDRSRAGGCSPGGQADLKSRPSGEPGAEARCAGSGVWNSVPECNASAGTCCALARAVPSPRARVWCAMPGTHCLCAMPRMQHLVPQAPLCQGASPAVPCQCWLPAALCMVPSCTQNTWNPVPGTWHWVPVDANSRT